MFYLESDFESFISLIFALTPLSEGSFKSQHLPRSPWLGVYNTGSGLSALMDSHPAWFSPGRPHCVILWLDGSARCPLPLTAQAGAARLLGMSPGGSWSEGAVCVH